MTIGDKEDHVTYKSIMEKTWVDKEEETGTLGGREKALQTHTYDYDISKAVQ